jgi:hypothetical protein
MIYAKILGSHQINVCDVQTRYLFMGTIVLADDDGRLNADARYLKGQVFSYDENIDVEAIRRSLAKLQEQGLIQIYEVNGQRYIQHPNWTEYQKIRKDMYTPSRIPSIDKGKEVRNETVTEPVPKSSKAKVSKVKVNKPAAPKAPRAKKVLETKTDGGILNQLIEGFKEVNPSYKRIYSNNTQRKALDRLVVEHGLEKVEAMIAALPKINSAKFYPTVTTPVQLENKLGQIIAAAAKQREGNNGKGKALII